MSLESEPAAPPPPPPPFTAPPLPPPTPPAGMADKDVRLWSMLCHLAALVGLVVPSVGAVVGPLVVWLIRRNDHPTIDENGKASLNFQLSILIYTWVLGVVGIITTFILIGFVFIAAAFVIGIVALVYAIVAAVKVSNGQSFRYPCTIRFFS